MALTSMPGREVRRADGTQTPVQNWEEEMPRKLLATFAFAAAMGTTALGSAAQAQDTPYFEGKTIRVIVGLSAGGTSDTFIRTFTEYWEKYIPGNPTVVVENMPGSGNLLATNYVYEAADPDGLTLVYGPWDPIAQLLGAPELRADYSEFEFVGAASDIRANYMRKDVVPGGMEEPADIVNAEPFNVAGSNPTGFADLLARMSLDLLGVEHNYVTGYRGGSRMYAAMQADEVQLANTSYGTMVTRSADFIAPDGDGIALNYFCYRGDDGEFERLDLQDDLPCFVDLYEEIHGEAPSGEVWEALDWYLGVAGKLTFLALAPPGTPDEALEPLREGFDKAAADEELQQVFIDRSGLPVDFVSREAGLAALESLGNVPDSVRETLQEYVDSGTQ